MTYYNLTSYSVKSIIKHQDLPRNITKLDARIPKKIIKLIPEVLKKEKYHMIKMDLCLQKCKSDSIFQNQTMYFFRLIEHIE